MNCLMTHRCETRVINRCLYLHLKHFVEVKVVPPANMHQQLLTMRTDLFGGVDGEMSGSAEASVRCFFLLVWTSFSCRSSSSHYSKVQTCDQHTRQTGTEQLKESPSQA